MKPNAPPLMGESTYRSAGLLQSPVAAPALTPQPPFPQAGEGEPNAYGCGISPLPQAGERARGGRAEKRRCNRPAVSRRRDCVRLTDSV